MTRTTTFHARLLRSGVDPQTVTVRASSDIPPRTLRRAAGGGGELNFDVYALLDADGWPRSATYTYVESLSRTPSPADT
ncbi:hypothetical protein ACFQ9V_02985 [Leifsonia sp. NPDC056665]|uniref:hypothetical protein n=1 Tax=Leifsonia sp. NPDC056665 TaxID=3345901 RepID=UPI00369BE5B8